MTLLKKWMKKLWKLKENNKCCTVAPLFLAILLVLIVKVYPAYNMLVNSFFESNGFAKEVFVGFENYKNVIADPYFLKLLKNTLIICLYVPVQMVFGLITSYLIYISSKKNIVIKIVILIPLFLSSTIVASIFGFFFSANGPINEILSLLIHEFIPVAWLSKSSYSLPIIIASIIWMNLGWQVYVFLGAMNTINKKIFDAAILDGASFWGRVWITLQNIKSIILFSTVTNIIWAFTCVFPFIHVLTQGGPGYDTTTIDYMIYLKGFVSNDFGYASALSLVIILIVVMLNLLIYRILMIRRRK